RPSEGKTWRSHRSGIAWRRVLPLGVVIRLLSHCKTFASTRQGGAKKRATRRGKRVAKGGYIDLSVRREFGGRSAVGVLRLALAPGTSGSGEGEFSSNRSRPVAGGGPARDTLGEKVPSLPSAPIVASRSIGSSH